MTPILQLDIAGNPSTWVSQREAICMMASDRIIAGLGENELLFRGGFNRLTGKRSEITVNSILLTRERVTSNRLDRSFEPPLTNKALFARDQYLCLYCGDKFTKHQLTRDHIMPRSRGGDESWSNSATACRRCNVAKGNQTPEEWGRLLLAVPYTPNWAEYLYLKHNRRFILADQQAFLHLRFQRNSPLL